MLSERNTRLSITIINFIIMALEPMDVKNIIVWLLKLAVAALYYYSLLASAYGVLDPAQLYATAAILAAALWFTYRYFTEVWPNREKVYVPEPWKGD